LNVNYNFGWAICLVISRLICRFHSAKVETITNKSNEKISFYSFNSKLIAGGKQLENESDYESDLVEPQSDILPGTNTSGVVIYPHLSEDITEMQIYAEGSSDNYENTIEPFTFDVGVQQ